jgi:DNA primase
MCFKESMNNTGSGIPKQFLDDVRHRLRLSEVIGKRLKVTRAGREFKACCPFHKENTPSFTINDEKNFFHCFGCGAHGDQIGFVMRYDNISFMDALESLAGEAGLQVPKPSPKEVEKQRKKKQLQSIMEDACAYFEEQLQRPENHDVFQYVSQKRGLSGETVNGFRMGYAPDDSQALRSYLKGKGWSDTDMIQTALLRPAKKDGKAGSVTAQPYAFFRDRVMFPVLDRFGQVVAFGGRILPDDIRPPNPNSSFKPPKYMNSTDTPLFHKGSMLYNESHARQAVGEGQPLIVVEGYADVIALAQAGLKAAVAPLGTALTENQIELLWRILPDDSYGYDQLPHFSMDMEEEDDAPLPLENVPYLCFDGDNAGQRAAMRAAERLLPMLRPGKSARFVFMPQGLDPDDLIKRDGPQAMRTQLEKAMSLFDMIWLMHTKGKRADTPESLAAIEQKLGQAISQIADKNVQGYYQSQIKDRIWRELKGGGRYKKGGFSKNNNFQYKGKGKSNALPALKLPSPKSSGSILRERIIMAALINHPQVFDDFAERIGVMQWHDAGLQALKTQLFNILSSIDEISREELLEKINTQNGGKGVADILNESVYLHAGFIRPDADPIAVSEGLNDILNRAKIA